jgi:hypothetical protein
MSNLYRIPAITRDLRQKIANSNGRIKHILIGWREAGSDFAWFRFRDYTTDAEFEADTRELYRKGAQVIYAVHAL